MKLTDGEKLILTMLGDIYKKLGIKGDIDPEFVQSAILTDNLWGLGWKYSGIPFERSESPTEVSKVVDILDMWSFIEEAYARTSEEERKQIQTEAEPFGKYVVFRGFDGNNEAEYLNVAHFLIDDLERFSLFKGRDLNSHASTIQVYRRMFAVFEPMRGELTDHGLSVNQIIEILKAMKHPD